jgi:methionyl-tRNA formyltransferase
MDEGPILTQKMVEIAEDENAKTLEDKLAVFGAELLLKTLSEWMILKSMPEPIERLIYPQQQDNASATYTKIITKQDGKIIWNKSAGELERQIRAFYPWPGSFSYLPEKNKEIYTKNLKMFKIIEAEILPLEFDKKIGEIFVANDQKLAVQTGKGCLELREIQLEGGKTISAAEFLNGHPEIIGMVLE